jgi:D-serine deaminase-like pyridoxal phosphate-dependent protein
MHIDELETPALVIDLDIMEANLQRVADYAAKHKLRLRPHTKTHKIPALGKRQIELGAAGLTVAKTTEAQVMLRAEPRDLLVAYPVLGKKKLDRLMEVARKTAVTVSLDSSFAARQLSEAARDAGLEIGVLAEVDAGLGRVGVKPGAPLVALASEIDSLPRLRFEGIAFYPGHLRKMDEQGRTALDALARLLETACGELAAAGLSPHIVSGGSTPSLYHSHELPYLNATVVSTAHDGQAIIDGGSKTFSSDLAAAPGPPTFGHIVEAPAAAFVKMNEEHGYIDVTAAGHRFEIGSRVHVIPNHICVAMNLHERVHGVRGNQVETTWEVAGRGKLQ